MNRFSMNLKTVFSFILACIMTASLGAQTFSKQNTQQMIQTALKNKLKMSEAEMRSRLERAQQNADQPRSQEPNQVIRMRSADGAIGESEESESEIHAAINPNDTNNIIVAAMKFSQENILASLSFPIYYTKDFGRTWKLSQFNGTNDLGGFTLIAGGGDPIIVFDDRGMAYLSWLTLSIGLDLKIKAEMHWATSNDGGATWKRQESLIDAGELTSIAPPNGRLPDKEWMASDLNSTQHKGNVYIAYAYINSIDTTYNIFVKTKKRNATTFGPAIDITPTEMTFSQFTSIDVDAEGTVHLMFAGAAAEDDVVSLYHSKSTDGGESFSTPVRISKLHLQCFPPGSVESCDVIGIDKNRIYPCPHLRVDKSGSANSGNLYAVWTADGIETQATAGLDIYYSKSEDSGKTWSVPMILNNNSNPASQQFFPSLAVNNEGNLIITWYDRREDTNNLMTNYYMTISRDGGNTFEQDFAVSSEAADFSTIGQLNGNFGVGEYTQVVATKGYALPFWADGRSNDGNIEVFTSLIPLAPGQTTDVNNVIAISDSWHIRGLFPNPVKDIANLELQLQEPMKLGVKLFSSEGKVQRAYPDWNLAAGEQRLKLDVRGLAAGQYWAVVRSTTGVKTIPLVVK
ncbi:MAG: hypothetical protein SFU99_02795 [Saprospiraceae bacterium]|nr:hypothetical protein [Saprospiraceae bacterium]